MQNWGRFSHISWLCDFLLRVNMSVFVCAHSCTDPCEYWQWDKSKLILGPGFVVSHTLKSSSCRPGSPLSQKQTCCRQTDAFLTTGHIVAADWRLLHTAWERDAKKINAVSCGCNPVLVNSNVLLPRSCHIFSNPHQGLLTSQSSQFSLKIQKRRSLNF